MIKLLAMIEVPAVEGLVRFRHEAKAKSTEVCILNRRNIGNGKFGEVDEADVMVGPRRRRFVLKKYKSGKYNDAQERARQALANYQLAKSAGLKVFPTFRISEQDGQTILMTHGSGKNGICLSTNTFLDQEEPKIEVEDEPFEALMEGVFRQAIIAADHQITLHQDAFFFVYDRLANNVDFVIGDYDNVNQRDLLIGQSQLPKNLTFAHNALSIFLSRNVSNCNSLLERVTEQMIALKIAQGYGNY